MSPERSAEGSHLFLVRLWQEEVGATSGEREGDGQGERAAGRWYGRVQHVLSGEAHTFRDWPTLVDLLTAMSQDDAADQS
jgi:hypothetical protein